MLIKRFFHPLGKKQPKHAKPRQPDEQPSKRWCENDTSELSSQDEGSDSEVEESYDSDDGANRLSV